MESLDCRLSATGIDPPLPGPPMPGSGGLIFVWTFVVFDIVKREKHEICV